MAATANPCVTEDCLLLLLDRGNISITRDMFEKAAEADSRGRHLTKTLLLKYQDSLCVEDVLETAARNEESTEEMFEFLLTWEKDLMVAEDVIVAAAGSSGGSMKALLDWGQPIQITEAVLKALASNERRQTLPMMQLTLYYHRGLEITKEVMQAARGNKTVGPDLTRLLQTYKLDQSYATSN
ncbi:hypothetical protein F5Y13DRAFT_204991 [Hypoxylon sp. FL1857]|nr:hypothetical protein F5Y13DRAFT_204991 [Hypoxylon sp. FL1857]